MKFFDKLMVLTVFVVAASVQSVFADDAISEAKSFFNKYVELGNKFDPSLADLYSDSAVIQNTRYYDNGQTKTMTLPAPAYKKMVAAAMPVAKARNDLDTFTKTTYTAQDGAVKIQSLRHSNMKNYDSWLVLLVRKENGSWKIVQELSQSRP